ncbi:hypothetical protein GCM10009718_10870 [Isoptericola halotolerans]|uniref:PH (Pleckstrin Homology) domain-containing protein n=1 Tax=Isoptericola halotolerans TaxID=300560 RepID=A0ABX1ZZU3_9MICO|nr:hypothetical protein [Isoptericola halotolerans]NOV95991.1 hypothetical protein [Isoptericola halotolerans]
MSGTLLETKVANALVRDAAPSVPWWRLGPVLWMIRRGYGGLWVGGRVTLTTTTLAFAPNALNRSVHSGPLDAAVELAEVTRVTYRWGVLTGIVTAHTDDSALSVRCWNAHGFAGRLRAAVAAATRQ